MVSRSKKMTLSKILANNEIGSKLLKNIIHDLIQVYPRNVVGVCSDYCYVDQCGCCCVMIMGVEQVTVRPRGKETVTAGENLLHCHSIQLFNTTLIQMSYSPCSIGSFQISTTDACRVTFSKVLLIFATGTHASENLRKKFQRDISFGSGL